jgi:uncharacterized protein (DUF488 family)
MDFPQDWRGIRIYTVGHSTRTLAELVEILRAFDITLAADIRTLPRSRHNPQFNFDALASGLRQQHIGYAHLPELGGLRKPRPDSVNTGCRNSGFRGFADYMQSEGFAAGLSQLHDLAAEGKVALMCAEAVPWRCHRSLIADALLVRGAQVEHITSPQRSSPHRMAEFARIDGIGITYPGGPAGAADQTEIAW